MSSSDWFRNHDWNPEIEAAFDAKLRRARDKSQYLRIQASYLTERHPLVALELLERYFALGDYFDHASAYLARAHALLALGATSDALGSLQQALQRERERPNLLTNAWCVFVLVVAIERATERYDDALATLEAHRHALPVERFTWFSAERFIWAAAHALILADRADDRRARDAAVLALQFSALPSPPGDVRLVTDAGIGTMQYADVLARVQQIAAPAVASAHRH